MIDTTNTKGFLSSKTVWAGIGAGVSGLVTTAVAVSNAVGHPVDPATAQIAGTIAGQVVDTAAQAATTGFSAGVLLQLATGVLSTLGGAGAVFGRIVATQKIG